MRPQLQRYLFNDGSGVVGDCHRTCIAMILDMDRDDVPHFMEGVGYELNAESAECRAAEQAERDWLAGRGLVPVYWGYDGSMRLPDVLASLSVSVNGTAAILGCTSGNGVNHSVVFYDGQLYNPNNGTIAGPMRDGLWYVTVYAHATKPLAAATENADCDCGADLLKDAPPCRAEHLPDCPASASVATQED